ncbi:class I SAM-dependent methyltransferase [Candidatus Daviesbacteria bacterium]|nr:class I SAM-dependent methyltransferase [Candidatus Daviesbacteria bacterium]
MTFLDRLKITLPFSYMKLLRDGIGEAKTILDLGCEDGRLLTLLSDGKSWQVTGVDIFQRNVKETAKKKIYIRAIKGDVVETSKKLIKEKKKFDVVFCSQVIEHLDRKKGEDLLSLVDKLARKKVIMGTPRGFMEQPEVFLGNNPHQVHKSGWSEDDFRKRGYKVYGIGFGPVWSEEGLGRTYSKPLALLASIISYAFSPIVYYFPFLAAGILCFKEIKR